MSELTQDPQQVSSKRFARVPLRMTTAMQRVVEQADWQWEDLLAAAEAITEAEYDLIQQGAYGVGEKVAQVIQRGPEDATLVIEPMGDMPPEGTFLCIATESSEQAGSASWAEYPAQCPITRRDFFMVIEHPDLGIVPTYGGPYDSYTIPEMTGQADQPWHKRELFVRRYDHDVGGWVEDEFIPMRVISEEALFDLEEKAEAAGEAAQPGLVDSAFYANLKRSRDKHPGIKQMFDGLLGEVHELKRAYKGDGNLQAEALDVAVCAYRIAMEGDEGGNLKLDQVPDWMAWNAPVPLPIGLGPATGKHDPLYATAVDLVRKLRIASISAVQRHLRIGYNRAAYLVEAMEGTVVSFPDGAGVRQLLPESPATQDTHQKTDCEDRRG